MSQVPATPARSGKTPEVFFDLHQKSKVLLYRSQKVYPHNRTRLTHERALAPLSPTNVFRNAYSVSLENDTGPGALRAVENSVGGGGAARATNVDIDFELSRADSEGLGL